MKTQHTPTPWQVAKDFLGPGTYGDGDGIPIFPVNGGVAICDVVARNGQGLSRPDVQAMADANAELICRAVNSHEALVAALKRAVDGLTCRYSKTNEGIRSDCLCWACEAGAQAQSALKLVEGQQ